MLRRIGIIINASAGKGGEPALSTRITEAFRAHELHVEPAVAHSAADITALTEAALRDGCSTVVAAGGDGTVSGVASRLAGRDAVLGVLPCGTLNHFAKDLSIPLELERAVAVIAEGHATSIDVGEVNGRYFLNNSSLGLYPSVVLERRQQQLHGRSKWAALFVASLKVWRRHPRMLVALKIGGTLTSIRTPFVFVGNNEYTLSGFDVGARPTLSGGILSVYVAAHSTRLTLAWLFARAAVGGLKSSSTGFELFTTSEVEIRPVRRRVRVALDGEVTILPPPLRYRSRPGLLRVLVPKPAA